MLIDHKIKFEKDGLTITQPVEPNDSETQPVSTSAAGAITAASHLGASVAAGGGDGGVDDTSLGGGDGGVDDTSLGGGDGGVDDTSLGGGAPGAAAKNGGAGGKTS